MFARRLDLNARWVATGSRGLLLGLAAGATAAAAMAARLPFSNLPLTTDEGGYGEVARLWKGGETLYDDIWGDRPQGLILVFRAVLRLDGGSPTAMRILAAVAGALLALLVMLVALRLAGARAAAAAGLLVAVAGSSPFIESFTLSGELLAGIPTVISILSFTFYAERGSRRWLLLAGLTAGCAFMVKQSAIDPLLAIAALIVWTERKRAVKGLAVFGCAALVPVALGAASADSFGAWWYALVGYRGDGDSLFTGGVELRASLFVWSLPVIVKGLGSSLRPPRSAGAGRRGSFASGRWRRSWACSAAATSTSTTSSSSSRPCPSPAESS
jgi:4-amino-4-deoxy-L-arabinose transferase-like glycosyltransferase